MKKITKPIPFQRFHKSEIRNLVKEVLNISGSYASLTVFIQIMRDRLSTVFDQIEGLSVKAGKHPETVNLVENRKRSVVLIKTIVAQVKNLNKAGLSSQATDLVGVTVLVRDYLKTVVDSDWSDRTENLEKMFVVLDSDTGLQTSLDNLNLKVMFDELQSLITNQEVIKHKRSNSQMRRRKINTAEVRKAAITSLKELFAAIELAQIQHPEVDFTEMMNGINQQIDYFSSIAKARKTRNGNKNAATAPSGSTAPAA